MDDQESQPELGWVIKHGRRLVEAAQLQTTFSILILGTRNGELPLQVVKALGQSHNRIIAVDPAEATIQQTIAKLEEAGLRNRIELFVGDVHNLFQRCATRHSMPS